MNNLVCNFGVISPNSTSENLRCICSPFYTGSDCTYPVEYNTISNTALIIYYFLFVIMYGVYITCAYDLGENRTPLRIPLLVILFYVLEIISAFLYLNDLAKNNVLYINYAILIYLEYMFLRLNMRDFLKNQEKTVYSQTWHDFLYYWNTVILLIPTIPFLIIVNVLNQGSSFSDLYLNYILSSSFLLFSACCVATTLIGYFMHFGEVELINMTNNMTSYFFQSRVYLNIILTFCRIIGLIFIITLAALGNKFQMQLVYFVFSQLLINSILTLKQHLFLSTKSWEN